MVPATKGAIMYEHFTNNDSFRHGVYWLIVAIAFGVAFCVRQLNSDN